MDVCVLNVGCVGDWGVYVWAIWVSCVGGGGDVWARCVVV